MARINALHTFIKFSKNELYLHTDRQKVSHTHTNMQTYAGIHTAMYKSSNAHLFSKHLEDATKVFQSSSPS